MVIRLNADSEITASTFGARGARLAAMAKLGLPVPDAVFLSKTTVQAIAQGGDIPALPDDLVHGGLLSVRSSPENLDWGGPAAILNIGVNDAFVENNGSVGFRGAIGLYRRFIQRYAISVEHLDPEDFENLYYGQLKKVGVDGVDGLSDQEMVAMLANCKALFEAEVGTPFPQDPVQQLNGVLRSVAKAWNAPTAKILRLAKGAPEDAGLAIVVQRMALGVGPDSGAGVVQMVDRKTGRARLRGRYLPQAQGLDAMMGARAPTMITTVEQADAGLEAPSLEQMLPDVIERLADIGKVAAMGMGDAFRFEFTVQNGEVFVLDAMPANRTARASLRIAVVLAEQGAISRNEALLRIEPRNLVEHLHTQIDPTATPDVFGTGLRASPGAATGKIVFSPEAAMVSESQEEPCILVRVETSPEDIRGMHSAKGVLTVRGGMTSHAAVIARGLGLPCVVGAGDLKLDLAKQTITTLDGRVFRAGDVITVDGTNGQAMVGAPKMILPELGVAFLTIMEWADKARTIGVRANADTPADARVARDFKVDGIGLCRTEHMFFEEDRITVMREMILANTEAERREALDRLLPMQRSDFIELFEIMRGLPVTIRLLDPPLHEFLPHSHDEMLALAQAMDMPVSKVIARADGLKEFNPMLGKRGVRLGVTMPEIYEMQARAIFEAAVEVSKSSGEEVVPEVMIPLVSANREVELVKNSVDRIAADVRLETGHALKFKLGVMVETPRAALRAGDLAENSAFLSFGTNDLTQMTYGLSRDDAGRFMRDYINLDVYHEDPFHTLDLEGVGELLLMAANRGRERNNDLVLGLCGEHGGDPASIRFCKVAGFDYVSCSPFRVPIARLAAAQASILADE
ncbi:MAG: pyruvate, phosphate dikinase [Paracoccaceae bacterium]|jgi:pyruvate,orthophosphate dikinase